MRPILQLVSSLALVATILPAVLFLGGRVTIEQSKWLLLLATIVWFVTTPLWVGRRRIDGEVVP